MSVLVDTSFLVALSNRNDRLHAACYAVAQATHERLIVPVTVLPEVAYLLDSRLGHAVMRQFVREIQSPAWTIEAPTQFDLARSAELLDQYSDARLDFVDATLIAIAERLRIRRVLTLDQRHFRLVRPRHYDAFELLPDRSSG